MNDSSEVSVSRHFLEYALGRFRYLKGKAERAFGQVGREEDLFLRLDEESNSIAIMMKHMAGNMRSRWRDFLTSDGEKRDRDRPGEFDRGWRVSREELMVIWEEGWGYVLEAVSKLSPEDLLRDVYIRGRRCSVLEAVGWQLSHYSQHVGQIIFLAKHIVSGSWDCLTIPRDERFYAD